MDTSAQPSFFEHAFEMFPRDTRHDAICQATKKRLYDQNICLDDTSLDVVMVTRHGRVVQLKKPPSFVQPSLHSSSHSSSHSRGSSGFNKAFFSLADVTRYVPPEFRNPQPPLVEKSSIHRQHVSSVAVVQAPKVHKVYTSVPTSSPLHSTVSSSSSLLGMSIEVFNPDEDDIDNSFTVCVPQPSRFSFLDWNRDPRHF